jgi:uncharacterized membrane protein
MTTHQDVIITVLGAAAGLAGLVLVFLGIVVTTYQSFPGDSPGTVVSAYRWSGVLALGTFALGIACVALAAAWLLTRNNDYLYQAALAAFAAQLLLLLVTAGVVTRRVLWP